MEQAGHGHVNSVNLVLCKAAQYLWISLTCCMVGLHATLQMSATVRKYVIVFYNSEAHHYTSCKNNNILTVLVVSALLDHHVWPPCSSLI